MAHLGTFDSFTGMATIHLHNEISSAFIGMLGLRLGMLLPTIPVDEYTQTETN